MLCGCIMPLNINKLSENALTAIPESLGMPPDPSFGVVLWTLLIYLPTPQLAVASYKSCHPSGPWNQKRSKWSYCSGPWNLSGNGLSGHTTQ